MNLHIGKYPTKSIYDLMEHSKKNFVLTMSSFFFGLFIRYLINYLKINSNPFLNICINVFAFLIIMHDDIIILPYAIGFYAYALLNTFNLENLVLYCIIYELVIMSSIFYFAFKIPEYIDEFTLNQTNFVSIIYLCFLHLSVFALTPFSVQRSICICLSIMLYINILKNKNKVLYELLYDENYIVNYHNDYSKVCSISGIASTVFGILIFS